jgi:hypothetical protein
MNAHRKDAALRTAAAAAAAADPPESGRRRGRSDCSCGGTEWETE